jgi:alkanesulfonate monooxygenase SsuD/methylene tetrahydromethanopterin reductase-like flavin-dependent oxidoreductase (luciferase family)
MRQALGAGVHVGPTDAPPAEARAAVGSALVGATVNDLQMLDALVGAPAQAAAKMRALAARLELDELVVCTWTHDPQVQLRSFELLSQAFSLNTRTQQAPQTALV